MNVPSNVESLLVLTACPDAECAQRIARPLVEDRLAACVNQLPPVVSTFRWDGAIESATEIPLLIKCTRPGYPRVEQAIRALHPYRLPEIIALPIALGYAPYLRWIDSETQPPQRA